MIDIYRPSATEMYFTMFDKTTKRLILNKLEVANPGTNTGTSIVYNDYTIYLSEQWVQSYCGNGGGCMIYA
jgi:hypothetical protein